MPHKSIKLGGCSHGEYRDYRKIRIQIPAEVILFVISFFTDFKMLIASNRQSDLICERNIIFSV